MNAIELLKQQHKKVKQALEEMIEHDGKGGTAIPNTRSADRALRQTANELVAHMVIEEHVFYPRVRELMKDTIMESFEEHAVARFELARALSAGAAERKTRLTVLLELIEHHVEEEEKEMLPKVKKAIPEEELERLGTKMEAMFEKACALGIDRLVKGDARELVADGAMQGSTRSARGTTSRAGSTATRRASFVGARASR